MRCYIKFNYKGKFDREFNTLFLFTFRKRRMRANACMLLLPLLFR